LYVLPKVAQGLVLAWKELYTSPDVPWRNFSSPVNRFEFGPMLEN
jgi:hypothetical protein